MGEKAPAGKNVVTNILKSRLPEGVYSALRDRYRMITDARRFRRQSASASLVALINQKYPDFTFRYLDVGARRGIHRVYRPLSKLKRFYCEAVEADAEEAERLQSSGRWNQVHACGLSDTDGTAKLYVTRHPGASSILKPIPSALAGSAHEGHIETLRVEEVRTRTLDGLIAPGDTFDFVKIDAQGADGLIVRGGPRVLSGVVGISLEAHFAQIYEKEPLFHDIHPMLQGMGFQLIRLDPNTGLGGGRVMEASNCVYIKEPGHIRTLEGLIKHVMFAALWQNRGYITTLLDQAAPRFCGRTELVILRKLTADDPR